MAETIQNVMPMFGIAAQDTAEYRLDQIAALEKHFAPAPKICVYVERQGGAIAATVDNKRPLLSTLGIFTGEYIGFYSELTSPTSAAYVGIETGGMYIEATPCAGGTVVETYDDYAGFMERNKGRTAKAKRQIAGSLNAVYRKYVEAMCPDRGARLAVQVGFDLEDAIRGYVPLIDTSSGLVTYTALPESGRLETVERLETALRKDQVPLLKGVRGAYRAADCAYNRSIVEKSGQAEPMGDGASEKERAEAVVQSKQG